MKSSGEKKLHQQTARRKDVDVIVDGDDYDVDGLNFPEQIYGSPFKGLQERSSCKRSVSSYSSLPFRASCSVHEA